MTAANRLAVPRHGGGSTIMRRTEGAVASREVWPHQPNVRRFHRPLNARRHSRGC